MLRDLSMYFLLGCCFILMIFSLIKTTNQDFSARRKKVLIFMPFFSMLLVTSDKLADELNGIEEKWNWLAVRATKFMVYGVYLVIIWLFNQYLKDLYCHEGKMKRFPKKFFLVEKVLYIGMGLLVYSNIVGFYYSYDSHNYYHRESGFIFSYVFPFLSLILQLTIILELEDKLGKKLRIPLIMFILMPLVASIVRIFVHEAAFTSITIVGMVILLNYFSIIDSNEASERARERELKAIQGMLSELILTLINALDKKDPYTEGHSKRVAEYSVAISKKLGLSAQECKKIYDIAILHDIGKIGIPDDIIKKPGRLTDDEFETVKSHTTKGMEILSNIRTANDYIIGAYFHHERYDGKGYPRGIKGKSIPLIARIIAVADSYDAMSSNRSYRKTLSQEYIKSEIEKGIGTQFDPDCARAMLEIIAEDKFFEMRETGSLEKVTEEDTVNV